MCPRIPQGSVLQLPYQNWLNTAICVTSIGFRHRVTREIVCNNCARRRESFTRIFYALTFKHFIHLGFSEATGNCAECETSIITVRPINQCPPCRISLDLFTAYLQESGDDPYNSPSPTIVEVLDFDNVDA